MLWGDATLVRLMNLKKRLQFDRNKSGTKMNKINVLMVAGIIWSTMVSVCFAQTEDVFVVPRVPVQAQADSANAAKSAAQSQGRRRAMDILLRRLTAEDDWVYLPNLRNGEPAQAGSAGPAGKNPVSITPSQLLQLESGFVVYGEKSSSSTYRALITYRFKPDQVRGLLRASRIPYSEAQTRTALVLPVLQTDGGLYLWEKNNPWMKAWKSRPFTHELTPMSAPLGDLEDASRISAQQALNLDQDRLTSLALHYSVPQVIVAHARLRQIDGQDQLSVRLINGYRESGQVSSSSSIDIDDILEQSVRDAGGASSVSDFSTGAKAGDILGQARLSENSGNFPNLAERAIDLAIAKYSRDWKAKTLIDYGSEDVLESTAFFSSVQEWAKIRSALVETPLVGSVQVSALSRRGAEMRIRIYGDPSRLATTMESQGLMLWTEAGDRWFIATPETATQYRGQRFLSGRRRGIFSEGGASYSNEPTRPLPASQGVQPQYDGKLEQ